MEPNVNQNVQQPSQNPQQAYQPQQGYSQQPYTPYPSYQPPVNQTRPNGLAIACMVLGICSILFSAGVIVGLVCAILALVFAGKITKQSLAGNLGPNRNFVKAGKICGIIGLVFSILFIVFWVFYVILMVYLIQEAAPYLADELAPYFNGNIDIQINAASFLF